MSATAFARRASVWRRLVACALLMPATVLAADWSTLEARWSVPANGDARWTIGGDAPNPVASLPLEVVRGRWVRFGAVVDGPESGITLVLDATVGSGVGARSVPARCDVATHPMRCTAVLWIPDDATSARALAWASRAPGTMTDARIEVADIETPSAQDRARAAALIASIRARYYRSDEADWDAIDRSVAAIARAPADIDPLPTVAQTVRLRLPGNKHMFVVLRAPTRSGPADAPATTMPSCGDGDLAWIVVPTFGVMEGDDLARYATGLRDCVMRRAATTTRVIDLRGNGGGNMYPMISGLAPLLSPGDLYRFVDGHGVATARLSIDARGIAIDGRPIGLPTPDVGTRSEAPLVVVLGPRCASSCEQVANALATRARTLFVGESTAGFTTGNVPLPLNTDYLLLLTEGYTADPCGRRIDDRLSPDVRIPEVEGRPLDALLREPAVYAWLQHARALAGTSVTADERTARCAGRSAAR